MHVDCQQQKNIYRMKSFWIFLVVSSNHCLVHCLFVNFQNDTERIRRSSDNMEKILFGSYNEYIESEWGHVLIIFFSVAICHNNVVVIDFY